MGEVRCPYCRAVLVPTISGRLSDEAREKLRNLPHTFVSSSKTRHELHATAIPVVSVDCTDLNKPKVDSVVLTCACCGRVVGMLDGNTIKWATKDRSDRR